MDVPFGKILSSIGRGVVVFDTDGLITYLNPHASLLLDYTSDELIGKKVDDVFHISMGGNSKDIVEDSIFDTVIVNQEPFNSDTYSDTLFLSSQGMHFPVSIVATPMFEIDKIIGGIISFNDISGEEKRRQELVSMRKEVSVLGKELEGKQEIERMNSLMIGRELKMAEMKQELEALKKKLEGHLKS